MAFQLGEGPGPRSVPKAPAAKPPPIGKGLAGVGKSLGHALTMPIVAPRGDTPTDPGYSSSKPSDAYKKTPAYKRAVTAVYDHQPQAQKAAILRGAVKSPSPEGMTVLEHVFKGAGSSGGPLGALKSVAGTVEGGLSAAGKGLSSVISKIPVAHTGAPLEQIASAGGTTPGMVGKNFLKDAVNLPAEIGPSVAIPAGKALSGHWGAAMHTVIDPYVHALEHPLQASSQHPLDTYLMLTSLAHPASRAVESGVRSVLGKPVDLRQPSVQLTANLTHERPNLSPYPEIRSRQKTTAAGLYERTQAGGPVVPKTATVRGRLIKLETSRLVGQNERVRVNNRTEQIAAHADAVLPSRAARVGHSAKTALSYDPKQAVIPGGNVLARIADSTIRRPGTVKADLERHLQQVAASRPALTLFPDDLKAHDAYVKELQSALNDKKFLANPKPAFAAASRYASEYAPIEKAAQGFGHFGTMGAEALQRRALMPAVLTHMDGARYDPERGMVRDVRGATGKVTTHPLSTGEMARFVAKQNGGRPVAFTSHEVARGLRENQDRSFYVNGQQRPMPAREGNTGYAFLHGLTHPGHEAMLSQRVRMQGIVDAHRSFNRLINQLVVKQPNHNWWANYDGALRDSRGTGMVPIRISSSFHGFDSLEQALQHTNLSTLDEEAAHHALDINQRLSRSSEPGHWGLIDKTAAEQLKAHENLINPGVFLRTNRAVVGQWRKVALATSFRHLPGVAQEVAIRTAASGIGPVSLLAGKAAIRKAQKLEPTVGKERSIQLRGGTASGQAISLATRETSQHFSGTLLYPPLKAWEAVMKTPGPRQMGNAWRKFAHFTLQGTKHVLEQNAQTAALGKMVIRDFGSNHGVLAAALGHWGQMIDDAGRGILDENKSRQLGSEIRRIYGRWTDLTPGEQQALMFSPFGMWWTNSVAWLARFPTDHPVLSGPLAAATVGTEKERQKLGLDMFAPGHLPLYLQGGIPVGGGKVWQWNYYSPMGVINDPAETAGSLILPSLTGPLATMAGANPFYKEMTSPGHPRGGYTNFGTRIAVVFNSLAASYIPLYSKAQTIRQGGATQYDTSTLPNPQTKTKGSLAGGLEKAVRPFRLGSASKTSPAGGSTDLLGAYGVSGGGGPSDLLSAYGVK